MQRRRAVPAVLAAVGVLAPSGCATVVVGRPSAGEPARQTRRRGHDRRRRGGTVDDLAADALADLEAYWTETLPEVFGEEFVPAAGGYFSVDPDDVDPAEYPDGVGCGAQPLAAENNAFYCVASGAPNSDAITYDRAFLGELADGYGEFIPALVMAHEFGHAIQARVGAPGPSIATETQADCLAGTWTRWVAEGSADRTRIRNVTSTSCSAATCCCATRWGPARPPSRRTAPTSTACRPSRRASTAGRRPAATTSGPTGSSPRASSRPTRTSATGATRRTAS